MSGINLAEGAQASMLRVVDECSFVVDWANFGVSSFEQCCVKSSNLLLEHFFLVTLDVILLEFVVFVIVGVWQTAWGQIVRMDFGGSNWHIFFQVVSDHSICLHLAGYSFTVCVAVIRMLFKVSSDRVHPYFPLYKICLLCKILSMGQHYLFLFDKRSRGRCLNIF